jgi:tetratricopeptide (TPR) repeat protein
MGKTSLLRRIGLGIRNDGALSKVLLPLAFREEQYNVTSLHVLWCNCLDALGDWYETTGRSDMAKQIDRDVASLGSAAEDPHGDLALEKLREWARREKKRPLLLLDNIDLILNGLKQAQWDFRRALQEPGGVVVVGASAAHLEVAANPEEAFYDFFHVDVLDRIEKEEFVSCLRELARLRGEEGLKVVHNLAQDPARVRTLHDLTGGNPRTLTMLYLLLESSEDAEVMEDLERLMDQATPLYKARVEELAPQSRAVFDAVALAWNPITAAAVSTVTGLIVAAVSSQLDRLCKDGILEKVSVSSSSRAAFQVAERFFQIWYLMRHAPRRQRNRLRWLTEFLKAFYARGQLASVADSLLSGNHSDLHRRGLMCLALSDAVEGAGRRRALLHAGTASLAEHYHRMRRNLSEIIDLGDMDSPCLEMDELRRRTLACPRDWAGIDPEDLWHWLGGSLLASPAQKAHVVGHLSDISSLDIQRLASSCRVYHDHLVGFWGVPSAVDNLEEAIRVGLMKDIHDMSGANAAARRFQNPAIPVVAWSISCGTAGTQSAFPSSEVLLDLADIVDALVRPSGMDDSLGTAAFWHNLACLHLQVLDRSHDAEMACRKALQRDPRHAPSWSGLGCVLAMDSGRYEESEAAYRRALEIAPEESSTWNGLGQLLGFILGRESEAEAAFRRAAALAPGWPWPWDGLGCMLAKQPDRLNEAESAFRKALELDRTYILARMNLAYLLLPLTGRRAEGEELFRGIAAQVPTQCMDLFNAYRALLDDNFGVAAGHLKNVLGGVESTSNLPAALRLRFGVGQLLCAHVDLAGVLQMARERGFGEMLLSWMDAEGLGDRLWPLRAALDAFVHGESRLSDVNPEVRVAARRIFDWLNCRRRATGTADSSPPARKSRRGRKTQSRSPTRTGA